MKRKEANSSFLMPNADQYQYPIASAKDISAAVNLLS